MHHYLNPACCSSICKCTEFACRCRRGVGKYCNLTGCGNQLQQNFLPLTIKFAGENANPSKVAARTGEGPHQTRTDHVVCEAEYGNFSGGLLSSSNGGIPAALNGIHLTCHEVCGVL